MCQTYLSIDYTGVFKAQIRYQNRKSKQEALFK